MESPLVHAELHAGNRRTTSMWLFAAGFLTVFVAMSLLLTNYVPVRDGVLQCKLWRYYMLTIPQAFRQVPLGPGSPALSNLMQVFLEHVVCSSVGGLVFVGAGWLIGKLQKRKNPGAGSA